jgi:hypothetical protein
MNNNFINNAAVNNNSMNNGGNYIMANGTIKDMDVFAGVVKEAVASVYVEGYSVQIQKVVKNNDTRLTGIVIRSNDSNIAPTIYLDGFFGQYQDGMPMDEVIKKVIDTYEQNKVTGRFDVSMVTDYASVSNRICVKLVNAAKNQDLLADAPHVMVSDLAVIFYIVLSKDNGSTATITVRNNLMKLWNVTTEQLYEMAMDNTQRMFRGTVKSMASIMTEMLSNRMDEECANEFYDMAVGEDEVPMYIATNNIRIDGSVVILYDGLLREFASRVGSDFYILPSSVHETILVPVSEDIQLDYLRDMVREINRTEVAPEEVLSDNVYIYSRRTDTVELA